MFNPCPRCSIDDIYIGSCGFNYQACCRNCAFTIAVKRPDSLPADFQGNETDWMMQIAEKKWNNKIGACELKSDIIGKRVRYVPDHANGDILHQDCETGVIKSANEYYVFVAFDKELQKFGFNGTIAKGCNIKDLQVLGD